MGAGDGAMRAGGDAAEDDLSPGRNLGPPAGLDDDGLVGFDEERGAGKGVAVRELFAAVDRRVVGGAVHEEARGGGGRGQRGGGRRRGDVWLGCTAAAGFGLERVHDKAAAFEAEPEALGVRGGEGGAHLVQRTERDFERGVGAIVADMRGESGENVRDRNILKREFGGGFGGELLSDDVEVVHRLESERLADRALTEGTQLGEADAVGGKEAGEGVDEHRLHAERIGDEAGVLAAGAAEAVERVGGDVVAAGDGDLLHGVRHVGDGDSDETLGDLFGGLADLS